MILSTIFSEPVILSGLGGLCYPLLAFFESRNVPKNKRIDLLNIRFFMLVLLNVFFALLIGYAYFSGKSDVNKLLAIHIGISAPLIIRTMAATIPSNLNV